MRVFAGVLLFFAGLLSAQTDRYRQKLQPLLENLVQQQEIPGFSIAVVENNRKPKCVTKAFIDSDEALPCSSTFTWMGPPPIGDLRRCGAPLTGEGPWPSVLTETSRGV
jgi:hypothetical protein